MFFLDNNILKVIAYFGLCFYLRVMLSKVFGRPLRMSLCNCYILCVIACVFYSTVYNLSLSVFLPCWRLNVFIGSFCLGQNVVTEAKLAIISANREGGKGACHSYILQSQQ